MTHASAAPPFDEAPHRRFNPLRGEWVLVSPHRNKRPWQGRTERSEADPRPKHDPQCYLCAGNTRANGSVNPPYEGPFVFANDFPALLEGTPPAETPPDPLFQAQTVSGTARVICFSERHDLTLAEMAPSDIRAVVDLWAAELEALGRRYKWVQIFENKGALMGCSNPHPHGQIWASDTLPNEIAAEDAHQRTYLKTHGRPMLADYAAREAELGTRTVVETAHWIAVVPYWAIWPYETLLLAKAPAQRLTDLSEDQRADLAQAISALCIRYDNLFETEFPYSMGWHGAPTDQEDHLHWHLHAHFYPPLLRSASVRKFLVGYEMLAESQRDLTPETAAAQLRALSPVHYKGART